MRVGELGLDPGSFQQPERVVKGVTNRFTRRRSITAGIEGFSETFRGVAYRLAEEIGDMLIDHVKTEYVRPTTGKGFTDRTGDLRASIRAEMEYDGQKIRLRLIAGMDYANIVEKIRNGTYAYLGPTVADMTPVIKTLVTERMKATQVASQIRGFAGRSRIADLLYAGRKSEGMGATR